MKPHKHAELIKAWADGAQIEVNMPDVNGEEVWEFFDGDWYEGRQYRIKPETIKIDYVQLFFADKTEPHQVWASFQCETCEQLNLKLTFDGETGELKSAEVLK